MEVEHRKANIRIIWNFEPENLELDISQSNDFEDEAGTIYLCQKFPSFSKGCLVNDENNQAQRL